MLRLEEAHKLFEKIELTFSFIEKDILEAKGFVLAENVYSDVNIPPFNKSAVDGYACKSVDLKNPLTIIENVYAGNLPKKKVENQECIKIMTGAPVPVGADCVIMIEQTRKIGENTIEYIGNDSSNNICLNGEDVKMGEQVLSQGDILNPSALAVAASVGKTKVKVIKPPQVSIIATGDELVEPEEKPMGAMIRNSNAYNLIAQLSDTPSTYQYMGIIKDDYNLQENAINNALRKSDIIILTGGVSMGDKDYIPAILKKSGLKIEFDKLAIQPGKPIAFAHGDDKYCFALSGNPVSSLLQFELVVKPFIYHYMGNPYNLPIVKTRLSGYKTRKKADRLLFFPIKFNNGLAEIIDFHGSAHITGLTKADGFGIFDIGRDVLNEGDELNVLLI